MGKPNREIKENYKKYDDLIGKIKNTTIRTVTLDELKKNHQNTRIKIVEVEHTYFSEKLELIIESKIENKKDLKFKLRANKNICEFRKGRLYGVRQSFHFVP